MILDKDLVSCEWLEAQLGASDLRIFDCSVQLKPRPDGAGVKSASGRPLYEAGHIPGAAFADLLDELSDPDVPLPFMMPTPERFAAAMSGYGVGSGDAVVLYNHGPAWWAMRLWFMLRHFGFDNAAVLDGGFDTWVAEDRPVESGESRYPPAQFEVSADRGLFAGKEDVLGAIDGADVLLINALTEASHKGETAAYARPGRIAGSINVPAPGLFDSQSRLTDIKALEREFVGCGAMDAEEVITYCGGGISAAADAFALHLLGHDRVRIYDGSMLEWARDPDLPMETG